MEIFGYSGPRFDLYREDDESEPLIIDEGPWPAPRATEPLDALVSVPGSKSLTNRELVLAALANEPTTLIHPLHARDTDLMIESLRQLGTEIELVPGDGEHGDDVLVTPASELEGGVSIDCGLAGTVMRFMPPVAALALGPVAFDGDESARRRPMETTISSLRELGVDVRDDRRGKLPFSLYGQGKVKGGSLSIDASASSQFVSGLLLVGARFTKGLRLTHTGEKLPSVPHIDMTVACLNGRGVAAERVDERTWYVPPSTIAGGKINIEPDLSNAEPFLLAAIVAGGTVRVPNWPTHTTQVGALLQEILPRFGAQVTFEDGALVCTVSQGIAQGAEIPGVDLDLSRGGELAPNLVALSALCTTPSRITGIAHLRGHETDRIHALATELTKLGATVTELPDGLEITPGPLNPGVVWESYEDHRMATSGALVGLAADDLSVVDIKTTTKTLPDFPGMWAGMLAAADDNAPDGGGDISLSSFDI